MEEKLRKKPSVEWKDSSAGPRTRLTRSWGDREVCLITKPHDKASLVDFAISDPDITSSASARPMP